MKCLIVDDDQFSQLVIKKCVERTDELTLVEIFSNGFEARKYVQENDVDLIFLDIEMPEMTGLEFIQTLDNPPQIILITSKEDYAVQAFENAVVDYIVKPVKYPRFIKAVERALDNHRGTKGAQAEADHLFVKIDHKLIRLAMSEILYVEALADYVNVHTKDSRYTVLSTMKAMESKLPEAEFARTHRSFIIRLDKIESIEENLVTLPGKAIPISRSYKANIMQRLNTL